MEEAEPEEMLRIRLQARVNRLSAILYDVRNVLWHEGCRDGEEIL
jgi:hypothetical protein